MSIVGLNCRRGYKTFEECLDCYQRCITQAAIRDQLHKNTVSGGYYVHREHEYHVTSLLGCPRRLVLDRMAGGYVKPLNIWKITLGTLGHSLMEEYPGREGVVEQQVECDFDVGDTTCHVVGRFDFLDTGNNYINDYKFVWSTQYIPSDNHFRQMACYEVIARKMFGKDTWSNGFQIVYIIVPEGGREVNYIADGTKFNNMVSELSITVPTMLKHYIDAELHDILPGGDEKYKQCGYCAPEFKRICDLDRHNKGLDSSVKTALMSIKEYRHQHTPKDED